MIALNKETLAVYLLDDDFSVLKATRRLLDSAGWNVEAFTDPIAFLEHATMHSPSVAVIDIRMPDMNGLEVQTRLRRVAPSTRVIVLTSKDDPAVRTTAMNSRGLRLLHQRRGPHGVPRRNQSCGRFHEVASQRSERLMRSARLQESTWHRTKAQGPSAFLGQVWKLWR